ncbi:MAG: J domain-containing protein [Opitutus sp.]
MSTTPTHYEILQVPPDAPDETIRAAFKSLALVFHPDRNPNSTESHRQMQALNAAFKVLGDPRRRAAYDAALSAKSGIGTRSIQTLRAIGGRIADRYTAPSGGRDLPKEHLVRKSSGWIIPVTFIVMISWLVFPVRKPPMQVIYPTAAAPTVSQTYVRPSSAPNGQPWPTEPTELTAPTAAPRVGQSEVLVDNSQNSTDALANLIRVEGDQSVLARKVYLPAFTSYRCQHVEAGRYKVEYHDLKSGAMKHSAEFELLETSTSHSEMKISLLAVHDSTFP